MAVLHFHTAGVRVDLVHPAGPPLDLAARVGAAMLAGPDAGPPDLVVRGADLPDRHGADGRVASLLLAAVERGALAASPALAIHATAVAGAAGCLVLPGRSGVGKSTLAAAALQEGLALVSDEAACFTDPLGTLLPHPRPIALSRHSRQMLGVDSPDDLDGEIGLPGDQFGATAAPDSLLRCVGVVLPHREPGVAARLSGPTARSEVLAELLASRLQTAGPAAEPAWEYLTRLVAEVWVARLHYDHPRDGAAVLAEVLG